MKRTNADRKENSSEYSEVNSLEDSSGEPIEPG